MSDTITFCKTVMLSFEMSKEEFFENHDDVSEEKREEMWKMLVEQSKNDCIDLTLQDYDPFDKEWNDYCDDIDFQEFMQELEKEYDEKQKE